MTHKQAVASKLCIGSCTHCENCTYHLHLLLSYNLWHCIAHTHKFTTTSIVLEDTRHLQRTSPHQILTIKTHPNLLSHSSTRRYHFVYKNYHFHHPSIETFVRISMDVLDLPT